MTETRVRGAGYWRALAEDNLDVWGEQDLDTLLLAAQEELGELTQAYLEAVEEGRDPAEVQAELDDLAPLMFQLDLAISREMGVAGAEARNR